MTSARELKKIQDDERLMAAYRDWNARELADTIAGPHGAVVSEIMSELARLNLQNGAALIATFEQIDWSTICARSKFVLLHELNNAVADLRGRHGLPVIDDPLPGQTLSVFLRIKSALFPHSPASAGSEIPGQRIASSRGVTAAETSNYESNIS